MSEKVQVCFDGSNFLNTYLISLFQAVSAKREDSGAQLNFKTIQPSSAKCKRSKPDAIEKTKQNYKEPIVGCFKTTVDRNPQKFINPVKKKKTIAFGRTVNISQTIEGNSLKKRDLSRRVLRKSVSTMTEENTEFSNDTKVVELQAIVDALKMDIASLTEVLKTLQTSADINRKKCFENKHDCNGSIIRKRNVSLRNDVADKENLISQDDLMAKEKWKLIKRKLEQSEDFRKYVNEGIMQFCNNRRLRVKDKFLPNDNLLMNKRITRNGDICSERRKGSPVSKLSKSFKTMSIIEEMTIEETQEANIPFNYRMKKYSVKHGTTPGIWK
ncbi:unnamed protein product [Dracunculus medinensis]|uniref:CaM_binding domain-containing protein n=1 Tax=Dracunculus medinensis TaxID=318479 RepID=A0A0N4UAT6_DRAME|nr:unnamed protein product [Dracunculus medinensis]